VTAIAALMHSIARQKSFFAVFYLLFCFLNAVWSLASGGFRIVFDTLVISALLTTCGPLNMS